MNYYEHHIGDFAEATAHLTFIEDAAYSRMIRKYYATERPMPSDIKAVQRLIGARTKEEREAVESILSEFFILEADGWHQKRCDSDLARYLHKQDKARASANARWSKPHSERMQIPMQTHDERICESDANASQTHDERMTNAMLSSPQSPVTSNQTPVPINTKDMENSKKPTARGSRMPPDFVPDFDFARKTGIGNTGAEFEKFKDHWAAQPGSKGVKLDWPATWRTWCRKAMEFAPRPGGFNGNNAPAPTPAKPVIEVTASHGTEAYWRQLGASMGYRWDRVESIGVYIENVKEMQKNVRH